MHERAREGGREGASERRRVEFTLSSHHQESSSFFLGGPPLSLIRPASQKNWKPRQKMQTSLALTTPPTPRSHTFSRSPPLCPPLPFPLPLCQAHTSARLQSQKRIPINNIPQKHTQIYHRNTHRYTTETHNHTRSLSSTPAEDGIHICLFGAKNL